MKMEFSRLILLSLTGLFLTGCFEGVSVEPAEVVATGTEEELMIGPEEISSNSNNQDLDQSEQAGVDCSCEEVFDQTKAIKIKGEAVSFLAGGEGMAIQDSAGQGFYAVVPEGFSWDSWEKGSQVLVRGKLTGVTCAYGDTVFGGECSQEVEADSIEVVE